MKQWLPLRNEEHKLPRKGIGNVLFKHLQLSRLKAGQSPNSENYLQGHICTHSVHHVWSVAVFTLQRGAGQL